MTDQETAQASEQDQAQDDKTQGTPDEKPEPDEEAKEKAAEMMKSYEDRPTLIVPGSGGAISGTAVNDWLDDEGNPKFADDEDAPANKAKDQIKDEVSDDSSGSAPDDDESEDHTQKARNVTGADSTTASEGEKTRGEAAEDREKEKHDKPMEEQIEEDKEFNKKVLEESDYANRNQDSAKDDEKAAS